MQWMFDGCSGCPFPPKVTGLAMVTASRERLCPECMGRLHPWRDGKAGACPDHAPSPPQASPSHPSITTADKWRPRVLAPHRCQQELLFPDWQIQPQEEMKSSFGGDKWASPRVCSSPGQGVLILLLAPWQPLCPTAQPQPHRSLTQGFSEPRSLAAPRLWHHSDIFHQL